MCVLQAAGFPRYLIRQWQWQRNSKVPTRRLESLPLAIPLKTLHLTPGAGLAGAGAAPPTACKLSPFSGACQNPLKREIQNKKTYATSPPKKATGAPPINRILRWHTSNIDTLGAMGVLLLLFCEGALLRGTSE